MPNRANAAERMTVETTPSIVIPTGVDGPAVMRRVGPLIGLLLTACIPGHSCSWAVGYFHQVTAIRGQVISYTWRIKRLWGAVGVSDAKLTLYEYRYPAKVEDLKKIAEVMADSDGNFDFGLVPKGHYSLKIVSDQNDDWFDVEVIDAARKTAHVTIDTSPVSPDCSGGHKFIEKKL
jgi:hypothetical protein